ncbi:MAG: adenosylcobinamide-GDP ribazoletransferase [Firmicutes bacterium]|nr:adenosylcobinamide-GDP ribazoletransferase [Bacillota bacterium]
MHRFFLAMRFLTVWPFDSEREVTEADLVGSTVYYPPVGAILGLVLALVWWGLKTIWTPLLAATLTVALWELLTAGLHLDGLMDTFDGLGVRGNREKRLAVMKDSRVGAFGVQVLFFAMAVKVAAVAGMAEAQNIFYLVLAPLAGRTAMVALMATCNYAHNNPGLGKVFADLTGKKQLALALLLYFLCGFALCGPQIFLFTACCAVFFLVWRYFVLVNFGGITGDLLGATCQLQEITALLFILLLF